MTNSRDMTVLQVCFQIIEQPKAENDEKVDFSIFGNHKMQFGFHPFLPLGPTII
jgi:hypothetical protein